MERRGRAGPLPRHATPDVTRVLASWPQHLSADHARNSGIGAELGELFKHYPEWQSSAHAPVVVRSDRHQSVSLLPVMYVLGCVGW